MRSPRGPQPYWLPGLALAGLGLAGTLWLVSIMVWPLVKGLVLLLAALS